MTQLVHLTLETQLLLYSITQRHLYEKPDIQTIDLLASMY